MSLHASPSLTVTKMRVWCGQIKTHYWVKMEHDVLHTDLIELTDWGCYVHLLNDEAVRDCFKIL